MSRIVRRSKPLTETCPVSIREILEVEQSRTSATRSMVSPAASRSLRSSLPSGGGALLDLIDSARSSSPTDASPAFAQSALASRTCRGGECSLSRGSADRDGLHHSGGRPGRDRPPLQGRCPSRPQHPRSLINWRTLTRTRTRTTSKLAKALTVSNGSGSLRPAESAGSLADMSAPPSRLGSPVAPGRCAASRGSAAPLQPRLIESDHYLA